MKIPFTKSIMNQHKVDTGQIGGLISIFSSSLIILAPFSFMGIVALNYDRYIRHWIDINTFIFLFAIFFIIYEWIFFIIIYPSMIQFANRQACTHKNPIYDEIKEIKLTLKILESKLKE